MKFGSIVNACERFLDSYKNFYLDMRVEVKTYSIGKNRVVFSHEGLQTIFDNIQEYQGIIERLDEIRNNVVIVKGAAKNFHCDLLSKMEVFSDNKRMENSAFDIGRGFSSAEREINSRSELVDERILSNRLLQFISSMEDLFFMVDSKIRLFTGAKYDCNILKGLLETSMRLQELGKE